MAIVETITDSSKFYHWLKSSDNYSNNFSYEGAVALQEYFETLSDDLGENIEFDPVAWCCEFSEYDDIDEAYNQYHGSPLEGNMDISTDEKLEYFNDKTTVVSEHPFVIASF